MLNRPYGFLDDESNRPSIISSLAQATIAGCIISLPMAALVDLSK